MDAAEDREPIAFEIGRAGSSGRASDAEDMARHLAELEGPLRSGFDQGLLRYGGLSLGFLDYARGVLGRLYDRLRAARIAISVERLAPPLAQTALADLFLSLACDRGVAGAWEQLLKTHRQPLVSIALRRGAPSGNVDELVDGVVADLSLPAESKGSRTRLGRYQGTGSLLAWLTAILLRRLGQTFHAARRASELTSGSAVSMVDPDPHRQAVNAESTRQIEKAFSAAWLVLSRHEALAVVCKYREGMEQKTIARILNVGEPRVSRIVASAVSKLREAVTRSFRDLPPMPGLDEPSHWAALREGIENSLAIRGARPTLRNQETS
jgi:RNA polymerase sigma factor (sigma-70 family)